MRAFSPASAVDKWRRFTLSSGFMPRIYTQRPLPHPSANARQVSDLPPHRGAAETLSKCSAPHLSLLNTSDRLDFLDSLG